jgi:L1 cell adhesion molecule like protein
MASTTEGFTIGIDLGTTFSCVGVWQNNRVEIISNDQGNRTTPSYVSFTDSERLIGNGAKNQANMNSQNTIYEVKRFIGRQYSDPQVKNDAKLLSYEIRNENSKPVVYVPNKDKTFRPEEISSMILSKMKKIAEDYLGGEVKNAVVTVPAYFNDEQRQATKDAGIIAGLNVLRIINEPTAAALAYGFDKGTEKEQNVVVYDLGGGTFDVSILTIEDGVFEVKATSGNTHLGGSDFDDILMNFLMKDFCRKMKVKESDFTDRAKRRLKTQAERAKISLSGSSQAFIEIDSLLNGIDYSMTVTRAKFEELCMSKFRETIKSVEIAMKDSKLSKSDIDEIVLVGGSTRIPRVQQILAEYFGKSVDKLSKSVNPDEAVAYGATIQGAILTGQGGEKLDEIVVLDVTPLSLGVEESGQFMEVIIPRGTTVPTSKSKTFSTGVDNQPGATIRVFEGERRMTRDNNLLSQFQLEGFPQAPRGTLQIEVTYEVDTNGILKVTACEKSSNIKKDVEVKNDSKRLSTDDIERMVREAEEFKEQDEIAEKNIKARNDLEIRIYSTRSLIEMTGVYAEQKDKLEPIINDNTELVEQVREKLNETETWLNDNTTSEIGEIEQKGKELDEIVHQFTAKMQEAMPNEAPNAMHGAASSAMPNMTPEQMAQMSEMFSQGQATNTADTADIPSSSSGPKIDEID